ncbi:MAG: T9SS type A sorting domain-containing protein [Chitinivibrionia bacterium]|nr:T9SS type A sorting domain-containing protein [Chitinivibrionia bacterium]
MKLGFLRSQVIVLLFAIVSLPAICRGHWSPNGVRVGPAGCYPQAESDGAGGAFVTWLSGNGVGFDISAQRIDWDGTPLWSSEGIIVFSSANQGARPQIVRGDSNDCIVIGGCGSSPHIELYAQRIDASGGFLWQSGGIKLFGDTLSRSEPKAIPDGAGGVIVAATSYTVGSDEFDISAQRIDGDGNLLWGDGVTVCSYQGIQSKPVLATDGSGGAIIAWQDLRVGHYCIFAQRIDAEGTARWNPDGDPVTFTIYREECPSIAPDGSGGAIIAWEDRRNQPAQADIYAGQMDSTGLQLWGLQGVAVQILAESSELKPAVVPDGAGGATIVWEQHEGIIPTVEAYAIAARRISASGTPIYGTMILTHESTVQLNCSAASDGSGGVLVAWEDLRDGQDIYAQRINSAGTALWEPYGMGTCVGIGAVYRPVITAIGSGNSIVVWEDSRIGGEGVYAQRVEGVYGVHGFPAASIAGLCDVPGDEGGLIRLYVEASDLDNVQETYFPVASYNVWQRVDDPGTLSMITAFARDAGSVNSNGAIPKAEVRDLSIPESWRLTEADGRFFLGAEAAAAGLPPGTWELVGNFAALQQEEYIYRTSTVIDSSASGTPWSVYIVTTHSTTPTIWWVSDPDSGYSVDNLAPAMPLGLEGKQSLAPEGLSITWNPNDEADIRGYAVYRGARPDFTPSPRNLLATLFDAAYFDDEWRWDSGYCYKIVAVDIHDNWSAYALLDDANVTGNDPSAMPGTTYLDQNYPNPFNPCTTIRFGLQEAGRVSLVIYDTAGKVVRILVDEERKRAVYHEHWDGRDGNGNAVASGVYFCRLETAGSFSVTRKMTLVR